MPSLENKFRFCPQSGAVLVITLLMVFMLTLVTLAALDRDQLDILLQNHQRQANLVFEAAESGLVAAENGLQGTPVVFPHTPVQLHYDSQFERADKMGNQFYLITSAAHYGRSKIVLQCEYVIDPHKNGSVVWWRQ